MSAEEIQIRDRVCPADGGVWDSWEVSECPICSLRKKWEAADRPRQEADRKRRSTPQE